MSTHSYIGYYDTTTGNINFIYCHYDGYPDGVGKTLMNAYTDVEKVRTLIQFGNVSILGSNLNPTTETHSFSNPEKDVCLFYGRDGNETVKYYTIPNKGSYESTAQAFFEESAKNGIGYMYIFYEGVWSVNKTS